MITSTAPTPTFRIAASPNRIASPTTVNDAWLSFTSGGRISIPIRWHSATAWATRSMSPAVLLSTAVMYSAE